MQTFSWTPKRDKAAVLVADDTKTDVLIASEIGVNEATLWRWKCHPDFRAKVESLRQEFREKVKAEGIANRQNRIDALNDRWKRMHQVIEERAADPTHASMPGYKTGLLVYQVKGVGKGEDFQLIDLFAVDTGLLKELREHEKQAAQELGQWTEKTDFNVELRAYAEQVAGVIGADPAEIISLAERRRAKTG